MASLKGLTKFVQANLSKNNPDIVFDKNKIIQFIETGNLAFDLVSGGGLPRGRLTEVFGMEHSGKTALALSTHRNVRKMGGVSIHMDFEHAFDPKHAKIVYEVEVDGEHFQVFNPMCIEEGGDIIDAMIENDIPVDFISFDSVDAMKPAALIEGSLSEERRIGAQAQLIGRFVTKMRKYAQMTNCAVLFINQMRVNINTSKFEQNVGTASGFNVMETHTVPGGYALRFYASLRCKLEFGGQIQDEKGNDQITGEESKQRIGNQVKIINVKNKVGTPFLKGLSHFEFPIKGVQRGGWSQFRDVAEILKKRGHMRQSGTKFSYSGLNIPEWSNTGSKAASEKLFKENAELMADARALVFDLVRRENSFDDEAGPAERLLEVLSDEEVQAVTQEDKKATQAISASDLGMDEGSSPKAPSPSVAAAAPANNPFAKAKTSTEVTL